MTDSAIYEVLNPRGISTPPKLTPLVERLTDLNDKTVYVINVTRKVQMEEVLEGVVHHIRERFPRSNVIHVLKSDNYHLDEPALWNEVAEKGDAAILGPGD
ncbi:MAG: hypothetical protein JXA46_18170 [Dehalococcoidales bacterium]|nr:hypothetical protein [Dehalococcoidales bacterium]